MCPSPSHTSPGFQQGARVRWHERDEQLRDNKLHAEANMIAEDEMEKVETEEVKTIEKFNLGNWKL